MASAHELSLPPPVMERIFSYFDATDLARMAQTCRPWRRIVYREKVWEHLNIVYRTDPHTLHTVPPRGARHIDTPSEACFLAWLSAQSCETRLPLYIEKLTKSEDYIHSARKYWRSHGCPCIHNDHFNIRDLLLAPFPESLSKTDVKRVLCRYLIMNSSRVRNPYTVYLEKKGGEIIKRCQHTYKPTPEDLSTSDPLQKFRFHVMAVKHERNAAISERCAGLAERFQASATAVCRHGISAFQNNDSWYRVHWEEAWDTACFSFITPSTE